MELFHRMMLVSAVGIIPFFVTGLWLLVCAEDARSMVKAVVLWAIGTLSLLAGVLSPIVFILGFIWFLVDTYAG